MVKTYFKRFQFSWFKTLAAILLASVMLRASAWQWERYNFKLNLIQQLETNGKLAAKKFTESSFESHTVKDLIHKKIAIEGKFDLKRQMIVINRSHATGPGYWLLAPFRLKDSEKAIIVSRGFIPFADRSPESWKKYNHKAPEQLEAIVQSSVTPKVLTPKNEPTGLELPFVRKLLYPDVETISRQLPYPVIPGLLLQQIQVDTSDQPGKFSFPAEDIRIDVPPEVHYGYTFEWIFLALATLSISFLLQAFPRHPTSRAPEDS